MTDARQVWVTRTQPGAEATAARLRAMGLAPLVAPVLEARTLADARIELDGVSALAFTSANGVRAFAAHRPERDLPAYCVGDATASAARAAGFGVTVSAGGDVSALAARIAAAVADGALPHEVEIAHPRGREVVGDLAGALQAVARVRSPPVYETVPVTGLALPVAESLDQGRLGAVLVHSPRGAQVAAALLRDRPAAALAQVRALAISGAALAPLAALPFAARRAAATPDEAALLALLAS